MEGKGGSCGEARDNPNRKYCAGGRAAAARSPGGDPLFLRGRRRRLAPAARRPRSGGGAPRALPASPGRGRTLRRAAAPARPRRRRRRVHGRRPPAPRPPRAAAPRRCLPLRPLLLLPGVAGLRVRSSRSASPPLSAAARLASHAGRPGWVPALSASLRLAPSAAGPSRPRSFRARLPARLRRPRRPRSPARPLPLADGESLGTRHQRPPARAAAEPRLQRRRWRQRGLRGAGLLSMRTRPPASPPPPPPPASPREWSWGLNYPLLKSQTTATSPAPIAPLTAAAAPAAGIVKMLTTLKSSRKPFFQMWSLKRS